MTRTFRIKNKLVQLGVLKKSPNGTGLLLSIKDAYKKLDLDKMVASMIDRASTNKSALNMLAIEHTLEFLYAFCCSHTLMHVGENFESKELKDFLAAYRTLIMHPGGARDLVEGWFGEAGLTGKGIRWYVKWEQLAQIEKKGIMSLKESVLDECSTKKFSEASTAKLLKMFADKSLMAKVIVAAAAQSGAGRPFCSKTYLLEGDAPLVFVAHICLADLDAIVTANDLSLPRLAAAAKEAEALVAADSAEKLAALAPLADAKAKADGESAAAAATAASAAAALAEANAPEAPNGSSSRTRRPSKKKRDANAAAADEATEERVQQMVTLQMEANAAKVDAAKAAATASDAAAALEKAESAHAAWQAKQPADAAAWEAVGKEGVQKGNDYYIKTFNQRKGDMYMY